MMTQLTRQMLFIFVSACSFTALPALGFSPPDTESMDPNECLVIDDEEKYDAADGDNTVRFPFNPGPESGSEAAEQIVDAHGVYPMGIPLRNAWEVAAARALKYCQAVHRRLKDDEAAEAKTLADACEKTPSGKKKRHCKFTDAFPGPDEACEVIWCGEPSSLSGKDTYYSKDQLQQDENGRVIGGPKKGEDGTAYNRGDVQSLPLFSISCEAEGKYDLKLESCERVWRYES